MSLRSFSSLDGVSSRIQLPSTPDFVRGVYEFPYWMGFRPVFNYPAPLISFGSSEKKSELVNEFWDSSMLLRKRKLTTIAERTALMEVHTKNVMTSTFKQDLIVREEITKQERIYEINLRDA
ncbi:17262_t:CDS:2 [Acaulospora colombiana]|uniref:17262_t:CDS:1 n=1 Tax=Acaulospora colombiana TaxID=27376 RepID=A0ACA9MID5_9GLOM|nr:17262_t:CDS:2 [Acaulospora colombiana]